MTLHAPLLIDIASLALDDNDIRRLRHPLVGGVILFGRNWQSRDQLSALCGEIKKVRQDLLICVDHEGGRVQRFKTDGFTHLPPMRALGALWRSPDKQASGQSALSAMRAATACGYVLGAELRACGVDLSFAPVLDLDHGSSTVIGDRAFDADPRVVSVLAKSVMHGLLAAGMANCGKHFPGHGYVQADSHIDIPVDGRTRAQILASDAVPFDSLSVDLSSVMPAHVIYSKVDGRAAGFSPVWLQDILRHELGFQGLIFSDDLSMAGAQMIDGKRVSTVQAGITALNAGCDMLLLCNQSVQGGAVLDVWIDGMTEALLKGLWEQSEASEQRRLDLLPSSTALAWDDLMVQPKYMRCLDLLP